MATRKRTSNHRRYDAAGVHFQELFAASLPDGWYALIICNGVCCCLCSSKNGVHISTCGCVAHLLMQVEGTQPEEQPAGEQAEAQEAPHEEPSADVEEELSAEGWAKLQKSIHTAASALPGTPQPLEKVSQTLHTSSVGSAPQRCWCWALAAASAVSTCAALAALRSLGWFRSDKLKVEIDAAGRARKGPERYGRR